MFLSCISSSHRCCRRRHSVRCRASSVRPSPFVRRRRLPRRRPVSAFTRRFSFRCLLARPLLRRNREDRALKVAAGLPAVPDASLADPEDVAKRIEKVKKRQADKQRGQLSRKSRDTGTVFRGLKRKGNARLGQNKVFHKEGRSFEVE